MAFVRQALAGFAGWTITKAADRAVQVTHDDGRTVECVVGADYFQRSLTYHGDEWPAYEAAARHAASSEGWVP